MKNLNGKAISQKILKNLKEEIQREKAFPKLAVILVGNNEASQIYVALKKKAAKKVGIGFELIRMKDDSTESMILSAIQKMNEKPEISGIIVQLPLPNHLDKNKIIQSIDPRKDVDGFHEQKIYPPVFPHAILEILKSAGEELKNKKAVILCNSQELGQAMEDLLINEGMEAEYVFRFQISEKLDEIKKADVIITACGQKNLVNPSMVRSGVIIVDGGIIRVDGKVRGDVNRESFEGFSGYLSPVPGGVGPVTIACLLRNVYSAFRK